MGKNKEERHLNFTKIAYNFLPEKDDTATIEIFDQIASKKSYDWWNDKEGSEVTPSDFQEKLNGVTAKNIVIRMNSGGGEVTAANVIAVAIQEARNAGKHIVCKIIGMCASAAVQIATSCDEVVIHDSALMMIHNPKCFLFGYHENKDLKSAENMLTAVKNGILNHYEKKTSLSRDEISALMDAETYMDGREAVDKGFADSLMFEEEEEQEVVDRIQSVVNCYDFRGVPEKYKGVAVNNINNTSTKGEQEMEIKNVADLTTNFPELVNQVKAEAIAEAKDAAIEEGVQKERERIKAIDEMAGKVSDELLHKAKYETYDTAEKVAMEAIKTGAFNNAAVLNGMKKESAAANGVPGAVNTGAGNPAGDPKKNATAHATSVAENYFKSIGKGGKK